jgi:hypothetical protein
MEPEAAAPTGAGRLALRDSRRRAAHRRGGPRHRSRRHVRDRRERQRQEHPRRGVRGRISAGRRRDALRRRPGSGSERGGFAAFASPEGEDEPHGLPRRILPSDRGDARLFLVDRRRPAAGESRRREAATAISRGIVSLGAATPVRRRRRLLPRRTRGRALVPFVPRPRRAVRRDAAGWKPAIVATHSPLLVSLSDATLLEVGEWGFRLAAGYEELDLVGEWRSFLGAPSRFLKHLIDE